MSTWRGRTFAALTITALLLAACGGDDDDSAESATETTGATEETTGGAETTVAAETTEADAATTEATDETAAASSEPEGSAAPATGEPIVFMTIAPFESPAISVPWLQTAIEARVDAINAAGGVDGRPLQAEFCNDRSDPNEAAACARRAAEVGAVAVVGSLTTQAPAILPVLQEEGIPWVGTLGSSGTIELTDPISYPLMGGAPAINYGLAKAMVDEGATNIAIIGSDNASSKANADATLAAVEQLGATGAISLAAPDAVDFSAVVATALQGEPDAIIPVALPDVTPRIVQAIKQAGFEGRIGMGSSLMPQTSIDALGADAEGLFIGYRYVPVTSTDNPTIAQFIADVQAKQADARIDEIGLNGWAAVGFLSEVAADLETVDGESIIAYLEDLPAPVPMHDIAPDYGSLEAPPEFPQARSFVAVVAEVQNGQVVQTGGFVDPFAG